MSLIKFSEFVETIHFKRDESDADADGGVL